LKVAGYLPVFNITLAILAVVADQDEDNKCFRPRNSHFWAIRAITMILLGPLLIIVDLIKTIYDANIAYKYYKENPAKINEFSCNNQACGHS
jgi:hypothetical protein